MAAFVCARWQQTATQAGEGAPPGRGGEGHLRRGSAGSGYVRQVQTGGSLAESCLSYESTAWGISASLQEIPRWLNRTVTAAPAVVQVFTFIHY